MPFGVRTNSNFLRGLPSSGNLHRPAVRKHNREVLKGRTHKRAANAEERAANHQIHMKSLMEPAKPKVRAASAGVGFLSAVAGKVRNFFNRKGI